MDKLLWKKCRKFHGDNCFGLAVAYRAVEVAGKFLDIDMINSSDYDVICVCENLGCGVDAVQVLTNCTIGNGKLIVRDTGKIAYSFYDVKSGENVRLVAKPLKMKSENHTDILKHIFYAEEKDIFYIKEMEYMPKGNADMFSCYPCDVCGEMTLESKLQTLEDKHICSDCLNLNTRFKTDCYFN